ncbi:MULTISPECIES: DNA repair protein RadC [Vagococcus]|uniref:DNA repair protein RadC n=1 Tax=Vagococcus fluvialis bH819 TaxID=1255619 RepID=A0A1X6WM07_9ENTE|nr:MULTISPECIES: DNA repair protein RadC [Vagococcus]SLM85288.1 DNA repair protein RadC [Vagococcus fluvialis bH819]
MFVSIKDYDEELQPRQRCKKYGPEALSHQELLAIMLRTGSKKKNVLELAEEVVKSFDNLFDLKTASIEELVAIEGIGEVKAIEIQAMIELGRRLSLYSREKVGTIQSSASLGEQLIKEMKDYHQEHLVVLYLNAKNEILKKKTIFIGSLSQSVAHPREIFNIAVKCSAARMIVVHNHPSGNPLPSEQDLSFTHRLVECGSLMGIQVIDHLIIGENSYVSMKETGVI